MQDHKLVSRDEWLVARKEHLEKEEVFHTYSCYARGLDMLNGAYHYMDLVPKGRAEDGLPHSMAWLRRRDQYDD